VSADRGRVLVTDDDAFRAFLAGLLGGEGYAVDHARSGVEALAAVTGPAPPDLVLLDARMPGMSGVNALRRMRERGAGVGVIVMSGYGTPDLAARALRLGASDYLAKPVDVADVLRAVGRWFARRGPGVGAGSPDAEDRAAVLAEAVALLLREAAERVEGNRIAAAAEARRLLARLERA
jgi:two-component system, NtrC family, response regulator AtoC